MPAFLSVVAAQWSDAVFSKAPLPSFKKIPIGAFEYAMRRSRSPSYQNQPRRRMTLYGEGRGASTVTCSMCVRHYKRLSRGRVWGSSHLVDISEDRVTAMVYRSFAELVGVIC